MKARLSCIACFIKQGINTVQRCTNDPVLQQRAIDEVLRRCQGLALTASPAYLSNVVYSALRDVTGVADPFDAAKRETNRLAMAMLPELRGRIERSADPLHMAVKIALSGNIIDLGINHAYDLDHDVARIADNPLAIDHITRFHERLAHCRKLLYLCDNAGEIAFDTLLIARLKAFCEVIATVKSAPIINDATMRDAREVGLTELVPVIETGSDHIGVHWESASPEFRERFLSADIILSKGQGNFETLNERPEEIFFLLKAKCPEVAGELGVADGGTVFLRSRERRKGK